MKVPRILWKIPQQTGSSAQYRRSRKGGLLRFVGATLGMAFGIFASLSALQTQEPVQENFDIAEFSGTLGAASEIEGGSAGFFHTLLREPLIFADPFAAEAPFVYGESFVFSDELMIRAQAASPGYWNTVSQQYSTGPYLVAQSVTTPDAASVAPKLPSGGTSTSVNPIAPPLTNVGSSTLNPVSAPPAASGQTFFNEPVGTMKRFWDSFSFSYIFMPKGGDTGLGLNEFSLNGRFAFPCRLIPHVNDNSVSGYLFIAPSVRFDLWEAPSIEYRGQYDRVMPKSVFEAALAVGSSPQFTKDFGADLWVQFGLASTCKKITNEAWFVRGRGMGTLRINDNVNATGGVIYYNRNRFKLLPAGGVVWSPNKENIWRITFPDPKFSRFLKKINETDWWGYIQGDVGGGRWLVDEFGETFNLDYNDYRVGVGVTFSCPTGFTGNFEVGGAFARELYSQGHAWYTPKSVVYLKAGFSY